MIAESNFLTEKMKQPSRHGHSNDAPRTIPLAGCLFARQSTSQTITQQFYLEGYVLARQDGTKTQLPPQDQQPSTPEPAAIGHWSITSINIIPSFH